MFLITGFSTHLLISSILRRILPLRLDATGYLIIFRPYIWFYPLGHRQNHHLHMDDESDTGNTHLAIPATL